jgi:hypothetical protein
VQVAAEACRVGGRLLAVCAVTPARADNFLRPACRNLDARSSSK